MFKKCLNKTFSGIFIDLLVFTSIKFMRSVPCDVQTQGDGRWNYSSREFSLRCSSKDWKLSYIYETMIGQMRGAENMKLLLLFGITLLNIAATDAKIFSRCQLAKELFNSGIPKTFISNCKWLNFEREKFKFFKVPKFYFGKSFYNLPKIHKNPSLITSSMKKIKMTKPISGVCLIEATTESHKNIEKFVSLCACALKSFSSIYCFSMIL